MKKFFLYIICLLVIAPCAVLFSACGTVSSYNIQVLSSDARYGSVTGQGSFEEGTEVIVKAIPKENESTFLCWALNDKIVSNEAEYKFIASSETQGTYVAIFNMGCEYYALTEANLTIYDDLDIEQLGFKVSAGTSLSSLQAVCDTTTNPVERVQNYAINGFFTGGVVHKKTSVNDYYCKIDITSTFEGSDTKFSKYITIDFNALLEDGKYTTAEEQFDGFGQVELTFKKLDANIVKQILKIEANQ